MKQNNNNLIRVFRGERTENLFGNPFGNINKKHHSTPTFTISPEVASIYSMTLDDYFFEPAVMDKKPDAKYKDGANVGIYDLYLGKKLTLMEEEGKVPLGEIMRDLEVGHEIHDKNWLKNNFDDFVDLVYKIEEHIDFDPCDTSGLSISFESWEHKLRKANDIWSKYIDSGDEYYWDKFLQAMDSLYIDTYIVVDCQKFVDMAQKCGYDSIEYQGYFSRSDLFEKYIGKPIDQIDSFDRQTNTATEIRVFNENQIFNALTGKCVAEDNEENEESKLRL